MSQQIFLEEYSDKSFVVKGDTRPLKDALKGLGGKWNSRLTDKESGEKFGAWLFFSSKKDEVEKWINDGCNETVSNFSTEKGTENHLEKYSSKDLARLEQKIDKILEILGSKASAVVDFDDDEDIPNKKRLL